LASADRLTFLHIPGVNVRNCRRNWLYDIQNY